MPCFGPETVMALKSWLNGMENSGFCGSYMVLLYPVNGVLIYPVNPLDSC